MNYFDDITFIHVAEVSSSAPAYDSITVDWAFGIMTGEGEVTKPGLHKRVKLKMPFLYASSPGTRSGWGSVDGAVRHNRWFVVKGPRAARMYEALSPYLEEGLPVIHLDSYQELIMLHQRMLHTYQCSIPSRNYQLARYAEDFMATFYDLLNMKGKNLPIFQYIASKVEEISLSPEKGYDFYAMAKENHVSYDYFRRCFKEYAGVTIREFMMRKRLEHALRLLENSPRSIKEITDLCGFPRQAEFARFIKSHTGLTPSQFRKRSIGK